MALFRNLGPFHTTAIGHGEMPLTIENNRGHDVGIETLHASLDAGCRHIDTAWAYYTPGEEEQTGEKLVREALDTWKGPREEVTVATKVGLRRAWDGDKPIWPRDGKPEHLIEYGKQSAQALGVDSIDLLYLHRHDPEVPYNESCEGIKALLDQGAPIDSFGVGTKLATCYDQPALGGVYKLSARRASEADPWTPVVKLSEQPYKRTIPGVQRVRRYYDGFGGPVCDMIYDEDHLAGEGAARGNTLVAVNDAALVTDVSELEYRELLVPIVRDGSAVAPRESIQDARERCAWALDHLDAAFKRFLYPQTYVVGMEQGLAQVRDELVRKNMAAASAFPWAH